MKKAFLFSLSVILFCSALVFAQADSSYSKKIEFIESTIAKIKSLPKEEQKQYLPILADVENRKNTLKALLKTSVAKRDKVWQDSWNQNYSKAEIKLKSIHL